MSRKIKLIIIIVLTILIIALLAFRFLRGRGQAPVAASPVVGSPQSNNLTPEQARPAGQPVPVSVTAPPVDADPRLSIQRQAASFTERFGSYSNEGNFENITDLEAFMSKSMVGWAKQYVRNARTNAKSDAAYIGTTTRALTTQLLAYDATNGSATVLVKTQRREVAGQNSVERVYYQDMTVVFLNEGSAWKVDSATWQKL